MAARDRREMHRRLERLLTHLLKWQYQPSRRQIGHIWRSTIRNRRDELLGLFEQSPAFEPQASEAIHKSYGGARIDTADKTRAAPWQPFLSCSVDGNPGFDPDFWPGAPSDILPRRVVDESESWTEADLQEFTQASWQHIDQHLEDEAYG